jgi:hypothetical protein
MLANVNFTAAGYSVGSVPAMQKRVLDAISGIPGVTRTGMVNHYPPLAYGSNSRSNVFRDDARDFRQSNVAGTPFRYEISPGYFDAARTHLLTGRDFNWHDDKSAPRVTVVNEAFARKFLGSVSAAAGKFFRLADGSRVEVVGVVEDGKYLSVTEEHELAIFLPALQWPASDGFIVARYDRSRINAQDVASAMRTKIRELDPGLPADTSTWASIMDLVLFPSRVATVALGLLGTIGAVLSIAGMFAMAASSVSRSLKELGIRMALGAKRKEVLKSALGRAFQLLAVGSIAGLLLGIAASRVLSAIVYEASPRDPLVLAAVVLAMTLIGLVATWAPAQRALSLDPAKLLREE